jgi:sulfur-oxidizing protein SoxX
VKDPADPGSAAVVQYTWGKLWNSKAYGACSNMPRFGHAGLLDEKQIRDVMGLLLDPRSPLNQ